MFFHIFRHVEAQEFDAEHRGELLGHFGLAHPGRPGEQVIADRLFRLAQAGAGQFDSGRQRFNRLVLPENHALERFFQIAQHFGIVFGDGFRRDAGDLGDNRLDFLGADGLAALVFGEKMLRRPGLVDHINGLVGQFAVVDVAGAEFDRRFDGVIRIAQVMMFLEIGFQAHQDFHGVFQRRLVDVDLLEPARQGAVFFEMLAVFLVGGRSHAAHLAALQGGFQQVGGVHGTARGGTGPDDGMNLVNEQDGVGVILHLFDDGFQAFFKVATIAGAGQERAHVE